ncbi:uncharacterized protein LOC141615335 [Silene latifolia]|uniref:uncharacterized protein LOC141615335 n=1 Tax=Silene latifolia TaxID=37657 RepID=UPI003D7751F0
MKCSIWKSNNHNKLKCLDKGKPQPPPPPKKSMGRPTKIARTKVTSEVVVSSEDHHRACAQPTKVGRGGRVIMAGRGVSRGRGGSIGRGGRATRRGGRGGMGRPPQGEGVLIDERGNAYTNVVGSVNGPKSIMPNQQEEINFS